MQAPNNWREIEIANGRPARLASIAPSVEEFRAVIEREESGEEWRAMVSAQEFATIENAALLSHEITCFINSGVLSASEPRGRKFTY